MIVGEPCAGLHRHLSQLSRRVGLQPYPCRVTEKDRASQMHESPATVVPSARFPAAAFFDLDKTLLAQSSGLAFARPFYREGLMGRREAIRSAYAQLFFSLSGANDKVTDGLRRELSRPR